MTTQISSAAVTARESSRTAGGRFGTQARSEAELELPAPGAPAPMADGHQIYAAMCRNGWSRGKDPCQDYDVSRAYKYAWVDDSPAARAAITPSLAWTDLSVRPGPWRESTRRELHEQWLARQDGPVMVKRTETDAEREKRLRAWAEELHDSGEAGSVERALLNIRGSYVPADQRHRLDYQQVEVDATVPYDRLPEGLKPGHLPASRTLEQAEKWFHACVDAPSPADGEHAQMLASRFREQNPEVPERDATETMLALLSRANEVPPKYLSAVGPRTGRY